MYIKSVYQIGICVLYRVHENSRFNNIGEANLKQSKQTSTNFTC